MSKPLVHPPVALRAAWLAGLIGIYGDAIRLMERVHGPIADLLIRFVLAQAFFVSGILKLTDWQTALNLARYEYPVSWMDPVTAAHIGVAIEVLCPILLLAGLATRLAALLMLILSLVIQFNYQVLDINLFWAVLAGWYVVRGAGPLSLDRLLARGLSDSALPLAAYGVRAANWVTAHVKPGYQLFLRVWIASGLAAAAWMLIGNIGGTDAASLKLWLPLYALAPLTGGLGLCAGALLLAGLATRFAALGLIVMVLGVATLDSVQMANAHWLVMVLAPITLYGAGPYSLDAAIERWLRRVFPQLEGKPAFSLEGLPRVVIVGAGFGGVACAKALRRARVAVTLVDRHNYHLFQPLLYQVATASLAPGDIAMSTRSLFREQFNTRVLLGEVISVDTARQEIVIGEDAKTHLPYDYLVLATGARHSYFGHQEWEPFAPGLKQVEDATEVRRRVLLAFERAEGADDPQEREALLTFLVVGGGPTGVELAGAIAELARLGMEKDFRRFDPAQARVVLVQSAPRILPTFAEHLSARAEESLRRLGVQVLTSSRVEHIDAEGVMVNGRRILARTVLWAAGVVASPAARWVNAEADIAGRVKVNADLSVPGLPNVFAIGDTALAHAWNGRPVPGLAPAAKQAGQYVGRAIEARIIGRQMAPFRYKHLGSMATIGRKAAVAEFSWVRVSGPLAWWLWGLVHVYFLAGMRNRISVTFDWIWAYLTLRSGTRLITGGSHQEHGGAMATAITEYPARVQHG
ncbi:MAG TPA: FAD-dependent oxidoreductase [Gammaproteobacteria bacterium]|nr:FAD-dependent oxidoreductase [Gammaproteobacteria bacterium]